MNTFAIGSANSPRATKIKSSIHLLFVLAASSAAANASPFIALLYNLRLSFQYVTAEIASEAVKTNITTEPTIFPVASIAAPAESA